MNNDNNKTMKNFKITVITVLALTIGAYAQAQSIMEGTNLNIGTNNTLSENRGNAIGLSHWVNGANSLAVGNNDSILFNGNSSVALGSYNKIQSTMSMAFGTKIKINGGGGYNIGIGHHLNLNGAMGCMVIGSGIIGTGSIPDKYLENNHLNSLVIGFSSTKPTLTVGSSPNVYPFLTDDKTGKVAIGDVPMLDIAAKLHIRSDEGEDAGILLDSKDTETGLSFIRMRDEEHGIEVDSEGNMTVKAGENKMDFLSRSISLTGENNMDFLSGSITLSGKVGINTTNETDNYVLAVNGGIITNEVFIKNVSEWHDHVFAKDYKLLSLGDLKRYINEFGHLPEVPSEAEVLEEGYNMAEMQGVLLKKIEELTLYTLKQQEEIELLKQTIEEMKGK